MAKEEGYQYMLFIQGSRPLSLAFYDMDPIKQWEEQIAQAKKTSDWTKPLRFVSKEGEILAMFAWPAFLGIIKGGPSDVQAQGQGDRPGPHRRLSVSSASSLLLTRRARSPFRWRRLSTAWR
jgi:hypothetical protein